MDLFKYSEFDYDIYFFCFRENPFWKYGPQTIKAARGVCLNDSIFCFDKLVKVSESTSALQCTALC